MGGVADSLGNIYCAGYTFSDLGETNGGSGNDDAFIAKIDSSGALQWVKQLGAESKALGGSNVLNDYCTGVMVDNNGTPFCVGYTSSSMGEASGGNYDAFFMKFY